MPPLDAATDALKQSAENKANVTTLFRRADKMEAKIEALEKAHRKEEDVRYESDQAIIKEVEKAGDGIHVSLTLKDLAKVVGYATPIATAIIAALKAAGAI